MDGPKYDRDGDIFWGRSFWNSMRLQGPCAISTPGTVHFAVSSDFTMPGRRDAPASIYPSGEVRYLIDNQCHRTTGPAVIYANGRKEYWVRGEKIDSIDFFVKYGVM